MTLYESSILGRLLELFLEWHEVFPSEETHNRAVDLALGMCLNPCRKTISNAIVYSGRDQQDWSADYKVFSRSPWDSDRLFDPIRRFWIENHIARGWKDKPLVAGIDTTGVKKTGKKIPNTQYFRDPMSPPFHVNLQWGQRLLDISALIPRDSIEKGPSRGIPVLLKCCPRPKKPSRKASAEKQEAYEIALKRCVLPLIAVQEVQKERERLDKLGAEQQLLLMVGDGEFANTRIFSVKWDRVAWLCRTRKDLAVYYPWKEEAGERSSSGRRRKYGEKAPTPLELRQDQTIPWNQTEVYIGEHACVVKYKTLDGLLWKSANGVQVRILVINGLPYRLPGAKKKSYRDPAYLMYIGPDLPDEWLVQWYVWRPEIEVNIRDAKQIFGVGHAQVWSEDSVPRCPAFATAIYGCVLTAAIRAHGYQRGDFYLPPSKWNRREPEQRPSTGEIVRKLREEVTSLMVRSAVRVLVQCKGNFEDFVDSKAGTRTPQKYPTKPTQAESCLIGVG